MSKVILAFGRFSFRNETWYSHALKYPFIIYECIVSEETSYLFYCVAKVMYTILIIVIWSVTANFIVTLVGVTSLVKYCIIPVLYCTAFFRLISNNKIQETCYVTSLILYHCCDLRPFHVNKYFTAVLISVDGWLQKWNKFCPLETLTYLKIRRGCVSLAFSGERRENVCHVIWRVLWGRHVSQHVTHCIEWQNCWYKLLCFAKVRSSEWPWGRLNL